MNGRLLMLMVLGMSCQSWAAVEATPLPEVAQQAFFSQVWISAAVVAVLGFVGLLVCTANKIRLHNGLGDIYLSAPVSLMGWMGFAWLLYMGLRGDDMLPYMLSRVWLALAMLLVPVVYAFAMARRCNPGSGLPAVLSATVARLVADMFYQLCSVLFLLSLLNLVQKFSNTEQQKNGLLRSIFTLLGLGFLNKVVWDTLRTSSRVPIEGNGFLVLFLNILCFVGSIFGVVTYMKHNPQQQPAALVAAVQANDPEQAMSLMALNPSMSIEEGVCMAVACQNYTMLNHVVRGDSELEVAMNYATTHNLTAVLSFLQKKKEATEALSTPQP